MCNDTQTIRQVDMEILKTFVFVTDRSSVVTILKLLFYSIINKKTANLKYIFFKLSKKEKAICGKHFEN